MNKQPTKRRIVFLDETCKTKNRINKKTGKNCSRRELRKQLQNDDLLKNYFVTDTEKDETSVFRIITKDTLESELEITKHVISHPKIKTLPAIPPLPILLETKQNEPLLTQQDQHTLFLLKLCCTLNEHGQGSVSDCVNLFQELKNNEEYSNGICTRQLDHSNNQ